MHKSRYASALASIPMLVQGFSRFDNSIQSLSQSVATITKQIASVEQAVGGLAARIAALEAGAVSASSVSGSAGSWPLLEGSTATRSRDPSSFDENRNTRRRLNKNTSPGDENARSAVLLRFLCDQCFSGMHAWLNKKHSHQSTTRKEPTAKGELNQLETFLKQEPNVKTLWQGSGVMASILGQQFLFLNPRVHFLFDNPDHLICEQSTVCTVL